jgi:hypothetical protein
METDQWGYPIADTQGSTTGSTTTGSTGSTLNDYIKTGGNLVTLGLDSYGRFTGGSTNGRTPPPSTPAAVTKTTASTFTQYLPWILGGGALLLLLGIVLPSLRK